MTTTEPTSTDETEQVTIVETLHHGSTRHRVETEGPLTVETVAAALAASPYGYANADPAKILADLRVGEASHGWSRFEVVR